MASPGDRRLSTYSFALIWTIDRSPPSSCSGNVGLTHFLMKHLGEVGTRKKRPASRVFSFLPAFGRCCPSVSAHPANRIHCPTLQLLTISLANFFFQTPLDRRGMASLQSNSTFSFKHQLTGEAWPACRAILPFHSNTT